MLDHFLAFFFVSMKKGILLSQSEKAPEGQIHFIASKDFTNVDFFRNITKENPNYDFSNLKVYINNELTDLVANSISANADDDIIIKATSGVYPWFGSLHTTIASSIDYIKAIEEPFPLMYQWNGSKITTLSHCFLYCGSLISIPVGLFDNNPQIVDFSECFRGCSSLTSIPQGLFDKNTQATNFSYCFEGTTIASIPNRLFDNCPNATDFSNCFSMCINVTSIPEGLFDNCPNVTNFGGCFSTTNIINIPSKLFSNNSKVTSFGNCFGNTNITNIPEKLFNSCPNVTNFYNCFRNCRNLASIPDGLFDNNTKVTNFGRCFYWCENIINIPQSLFDKNTQVTNFSDCFYDCYNLIVNVQIGSTASLVNVSNFATSTKEKGTVYCREGSAAYTAFSEDSSANVNVLAY